MRGKKHSTSKLRRNNSVGNVVSSVRQKLSRVEFVQKINSLHRNTKLAITLVAILLITSLISIGIFRGNDSNDTTDEQASSGIDQVGEISAKVTLREGVLQTKSQEGTWTDVTADIDIKKNDELRTVGASSRAIIQFENGSELRLDAATDVVFESMNDNRVVVMQLSGYAYSRIIRDSDVSFIIKSTDAQYEALGTAFTTIVSGDEQAVEVYESSVLETSTNKQPKQGEKLIIKSRVNPQDNGSLKPLDIEVVKKNLFMQWNREQDMKNDNFKDKLGFLNDVDAPDISITNPQENTVILLEPNATEGTVTFSGSTERSARLTVESKSLAGSQPVSVTIDDSGNFTSPVITAPLGESVFEFVVKDKIGNTATKSVRLSFQRKSAPITATAGIALDVVYKNNKFEASWAYGGSATAEDGVKIVYSKQANPTLENAKSLYVKNATSKTFTISGSVSGETYNFRACIYNSSNSKCDAYSNNVVVPITE